MTPHKPSPQSKTESTPPQIVELVDARLLRCPLPLLKAKQALNRVVVGQAIEVLATDSGSVRDFHEFARLSGHSITSFSDEDGVYRYVMLRKSENTQ